MEPRVNKLVRYVSAIALAALLVLSMAGCDDLPLLGIIREIKNPAVTTFVSTQGPPGAIVRAITVSGTTVYAGCEGGGVYRSGNTGVTWAAVGKFLPHDVRALATDGAYLYAGTGDGLSSSYDGTYRIALSGGSWQHFGIDESVWALMASGGYLYAGTGSQGVWRIQLSGGSWAQYGTGLPAGRIYCLAVDGSGNPFAGAADNAYHYSGGTWSAVGSNSRAWTMVYDGSNLYVTSNLAGVQYWNGAAWAPYGTGLSSSRNPSLARTSSYLYVGDSSGGVFRCTGAGNAWTRFGSASDDLTSNDANALASLGSTILAGAGVGPGVYTLSESTGSSAWSKAGSGIFSSTAYDLATDGTSLFAATDRGAFSRPLAGGFWSDFGSGGPTGTVYDLVIDGTYLYAGGSAQVMRVSLSGGAWSAFGTGLGSNDIRALHSDGTYLYAGTWTGDVYRLLLTAPGGTWASWGPVADSGNGAYQFFEANSTLYKASNQGVFYKALSGSTWYRLGSATYGFYGFASDGTYLYAGTYNNGVKRIPLSGLDDWTDLGTGLPAETVWALQIVGGRMIATLEGMNLYSVPISGGAWAPYGQGLFDATTVGAFLLDGQTLYVGTGEFSLGGSGVWQGQIASP